MPAVDYPTPQNRGDMPGHLLALDQGTSGSRGIVFHRSGRVVALAQLESTQIFPQPGWVEHDPMEIWHTQLSVAQQALAHSGVPLHDIAGIGTAAAQVGALPSSAPQYALEGSVFIGSTVPHIARAAVESIAFQSTALLQAMAHDAQPVAELRVDGGASVNDMLMQFQADPLGTPVVPPQVTETTALGAAYLAGLATGMYSGVDELAAQWQLARRFEPRMPRSQAQERMAAREAAAAQARGR